MCVCVCVCVIASRFNAIYGSPKVPITFIGSRMTSGRRWVGVGGHGLHAVHIMAYGSTPYVGMAPEKNGGHIKSA